MLKKIFIVFFEVGGGIGVFDSNFQIKHILLFPGLFKKEFSGMFQRLS